MGAVSGIAVGAGTADDSDGRRRVQRCDSIMCRPAQDWLSCLLQRRVVQHEATCQKWATALGLCLSMQGGPFSHQVMSRCFRCKLPSPRGISVPPNDKTLCTASNACAGAAQWEDTDMEGLFSSLFSMSQKMTRQESLRITETDFKNANSAKARFHGPVVLH